MPTLGPRLFYVLVVQLDEILLRQIADAGPVAQPLIPDGMLRAAAVVVVDVIVADTGVLLDVPEDGVQGPGIDGILLVDGAEGVFELPSGGGA